MFNRLTLIAGLLGVYLFAGLFTHFAIASAQDDNMCNNDQKSLTTPCNKLSQLGLSVTCGANILALGFHKKTGESKADFEKRLQTDFDGEIAIGDVNSEPISIIKYHDFSGFAESPSGETYGPVYTFNIDCSGTKRYYVMVLPTIRSKEENAYTLSLSPLERNKSFWAGLFGGNTDTTDAKNKINKTFQTFAATDRDAITIPAPVERIDMFIDIPGNGYRFSVRFPFKKPIISYADIDRIANRSYAGTMKILYNNIPIYDMPIRGRISIFGGDIIEGIPISYGNWSDGFEAKERGIYSFIPSIFSSEESEFKRLSFDNSVFALRISRFRGFVK